MGTINYCTSDYITLGIEPYNLYDFEQDQEFMEEMQAQANEYGGSIEDAVNEYISRCYEDDYYNVKDALEKHSFYYYHVAIKWGYYEGFYLDIENNFGIAYDSWKDRREAQKEITQIKQFLTECAGLGLVQCFPGWCTGYSNYTGTIRAIDEAVKAMREEAQTIPTWTQYEKEA